MPKPNPETRFWKTLSLALKEHEAYAVKFHGNAFTKKGVADIHITHTQWTGWLELKCDSNKYAPLQVKHMQMVREAGGNSFGFRFLTDTRTYVVEDYEDRAFDERNFKGVPLLILTSPLDVSLLLSSLTGLSAIMRAKKIATTELYTGLPNLLNSPDSVKDM